MTYKECRTCLSRKPLKDFYRHTNSTDGFLHICKECTKVRTRRNSQTPKGRIIHNAATKRWAEKNTTKRKAHIALCNAVANGKITKPILCENCRHANPNGAPLHGHHHDHTKPLDVRWLCTTCHTLEHKQEHRQ